MKSFKFKYANSVWMLLVLVLILALVGLSWNVFNLLEYCMIGFTRVGAFKIVVYALLVLMLIVLTVLVVSVMLYGRYTLKGEYLYTVFGFIKSKVSVSEITGITHFKKSDKLVAYFKDEKYSVIVISPDRYDEFVLAIRAVNSACTFDVRIDGEDTPNN